MGQDSMNTLATLMSADLQDSSINFWSFGDSLQVQQGPICRALERSSHIFLSVYFPILPSAMVGIFSALTSSFT